MEPQKTNGALTRFHCVVSETEPNKLISIAVFAIPLWLDILINIRINGLLVQKVSSLEHFGIFRLIYERIVASRVATTTHHRVYDQLPELNQLYIDHFYNLLLIN